MFIKTISKSRRRMLKFTVCGFILGVPGLPTGRSSREPTAMANSPYAGTLLSGSMREIGREYLNNFPAERSRSILLSSIQSRLDDMNVCPHNPSWSELKNVITDDFRSDDVVYLKGWALSHTEARLAALSVV